LVHLVTKGKPIPKEENLRQKENCQEHNQNSNANKTEKLDLTLQYDQQKKKRSKEQRNTLKTLKLTKVMTMTHGTLSLQQVSTSPCPPL